MNKDDYLALEGTTEASYVKYLEHRAMHSPIKLLIQELWDKISHTVDMQTHKQMLFDDGYRDKGLTPNEKRALNRAITCMHAMQYVEAEWTPHMQKMMEDFDG